MNIFKSLLVVTAVMALPAGVMAQSITLASTVPNAGTNAVVVEKLVGEIEAAVADVKVDVFLEGALGSERELLDLLRIGETNIHMGVIHAAQYFPEIDATLVPYLFPDYASIQAFLSSKTGDRLKLALEERGNAKFLGTYYQGSRWTTSNKAFRTLDELKGIKIRMPEIPLWISIWSGLGATTTPMPSPEVFSGLQTGVIDAQENMLSNILGRHLNEVQKYLIATEHQHSYVTVMANLDFWNKLDPAIQDAIQNAVDIATAAGTKTSRDENQALIDAILASGVELIEPAPSFRTDAMPIIKAAAEATLEENIYQEALRVIENSRRSSN